MDSTITCVLCGMGSTITCVLCGMDSTITCSMWHGFNYNLCFMWHGFNYNLCFMWHGFLKSQVVYSKQPKLGLTQEFVEDCAHALWVVHLIKRLVSLMLLKWFLSDSFIYFMYRMFKEIF